MNTIKFCVVLVLLFFSHWIVNSYDQVFDSVKLRYGKSYYFNDSFKNTWNTTLELQSFKVTFREEANFNNWANPTFSPTQAVKNDKVFSPGEKKVILESSPAYGIKRHPVTRKSNNIEIIYETTDKVLSNWKITTHTEYQPYEITWCGDGIVDNYTDPYGAGKIVETCDPADSSKKNWGTGGCSNSCKPVTAPTPPSCTDIDVKPTTGTVPFSSNISCTGKNADTYKIEIKKGNSIVKTINSKTGNYQFTSDGTYTAQCFVNNTVTSKECKQTITAKPTVPPVYDLALDKKIVGKKSGYKLGENVTFAITVTNQWEAVARNFTITDYIPAGLELIDTAWTQSGNKATKNISKTLNKNDSYTVNIRFKIVSDSNLTIRNYAEISSDDGDDCDSTPDSTNGNGTGETTGLVDDAIGTGCEPGGDEDDHDIAVITLEDPVYDLALVKKLSVNSTGPFKSGDNVTFDISVTNQGTVDAQEITITDYIPTGLELNDTAWTQSGNKATRKMYEISAGQTKKLSITFKITQTTAGTINNYAEISSDDGDDCDSTPDSTNGNGTGETTGLVDDAIGTGCEPGGDEDDHDIAGITLEDTVYDLALTKTLSSLQDTFTANDDVRFIITLTNQWNVVATVKEIVDYIPTGLELNDTNWSESNGIARYTQDITLNPGEQKTVEINFIVSETATGVIENFAEISSDDGDDCDSTPDSVNGNWDGESTDLVDDQIGSGCEQWGDEDDHDIEVITIVEPSYDLALRKVVKTTGLLNKWDTVTFTITVFNQGTIDSGVVEITDYIPNGLTLTGSTWTQSGSIAVRTIANIPAGGNTPVDIAFTIDNDAPKNINNFAEISSDNWDDCDSTPDSVNGNWDGESTDLVDDQIGSGCEPGGDEDDHDIAPIVIEDGDVVNPSCDSVTASPNSGRWNSLTTTLTCNWTAVDTYRIEVRDEAGNLVNTINAATGQVTLNRGAASTANFTAKCFVNNTITSNSCEQSLSISNNTWGGSTASCLDIIKTGSDTYQCIWDDDANSISMRCGTNPDTGNTVYLPTQAWVLGTDNRRTANFTCSDAVPKCIVRKVPWAPTPTNENNWVDSAACEYSAGFCWDGVVWFRADGTQEVCDAWTNNGKPGFTCTAQCTIPGGGSSSGGSSGWSSTSSSGGWEIICDPEVKTCSVTTTPTGGEIVFGPFGGTIVGHAKNILESIPEFPFIQNTSEYDYSFDELCIKKTDGDNSVNSPTLSNNEICISLSNRMLYGYEKFVIAQKKSDNSYVALSGHEIDRDQISANPVYKYPDFMSNKDAIHANKDYWQAILTTSMKHDIDRNGTIDELYSAYFAADLDVRVAKPSIATIGGWTSYIKNGSETTGDIKKVTDNIAGFEDNTNFVWVSVGDDGVSSSVETNTDTTVIEDTEAKNDNYTQDVNDVTQNTTTSVANVSGYDEFSNFNGLDNVYILKGKNITLAELPAWINTPTTYIVEGGNLTLTKDIVTNENIAFVVKGWNITIKEDVEKLSGTYIAIPTNDTNWKIISESSNKQLVVYGSLLWNLSELVSNRYYIEKTGNQLSVGTIVSFGSRLLSKPAPLVAQFKSEYNASQKVAK